MRLTPLFLTSNGRFRLILKIVRRIWLLSILLAWLSVPPARAQTVYGPGGLLINPSALIPARGELDLNVSWYSQHIEGQPTSQWIPVSLAYTPTDRLQLG